ncbi:hypothetical protein [Sphingorhabdus sp.]|uniref:hypothetical protein n=1 Tax=Sphingorhabdus sp. TaxID=1902408 RepID=UPI0035B0FE47
MTAKDRIEGDWQILIGDYGEPTEGKLNFTDGVVEASGYWDGTGSYSLKSDVLSIKLGDRKIELGPVGPDYFSGHYRAGPVDVLVAIRRVEPVGGPKLAKAVRKDPALVEAWALR